MPALHGDASMRVEGTHHCSPADGMTVGRSLFTPEGCYSCRNAVIGVATLAIAVPHCRSTIGFDGEKPSRKIAKINEMVLKEYQRRTLETGQEFLEQLLEWRAKAAKLSESDPDMKRFDWVRAAWEKTSRGRMF